MNKIYIFFILINLVFIKAEDCKDYSFLPNEEIVKFIGRYVIKNEVTWLVQSGSAIEFYAKGNNIELILSGDIHLYIKLPTNVQDMQYISIMKN